jgi:hypothetical protein
MMVNLALTLPLHRCGISNSLLHRIPVRAVLPRQTDQLFISRYQTSMHPFCVRCNNINHTVYD